MFGDVGKNRAQIVAQFPVVRFGGKVGNARIEVERPHAMPVRFAQMADVDVILRAEAVVLINELLGGVCSAAFQKEFCHIQIDRLARVAVERNEREFDFLVSRGGEGGGLFGDEGAADAVAVALDDVQEAILSGCLVVGDCRFDQMPRAVQLVVVPHAEDQFGGQLLVGGVEVAVGTLRRFHIGDQFFAKREVLPHGFWIFDRQICHRFHPLGNVGIVEDVRAAGVFQIVEAERVKPTAFLKPFPHIGNRNGLVQFITVMPESVIQVDLLKWEKSALFHEICLHVLTFCL